MRLLLADLEISEDLGSNPSSPTSTLAQIIRRYTAFLVKIKFVVHQVRVMDYRYLAAVAVFLVLGAGLFVFGPLGFMGNEENSYGDLRSEARDSSYMVSYEADFADQISAGMVNYQEVRLYSSEGLQRQESSWTMSITEGVSRQVSFIKGNRSVTCSKKEEGINRSSCEVSGTDFDFLHDLGKRADKLGLNITRKDSYEIAGRQCQRFSFETSTNSTPASGQIKGDARYDVCLDKKKGYVAAISVTANMTPLLGEKTQRTTIVNMEAKDIDTEFKGSVEPPFSFEARSDCFWTDPVVKVMSFKNISQVKIEVNGENLTYDLGNRYEISEFELPEENLDEGREYNVKVYAENKSTETSCLYSTFEG